MTKAQTATQFTSILDALDLKELEPQEQEDILLDLGELIFKGTMLRLLERMDEKTKDAFSDLLEKNGSEEEVEAFITKHVPDADMAVKESLTELTDDILAVTKSN